MINFNTIEEIINSGKVLKDTSEDLKYIKERPQELAKLGYDTSTIQNRLYFELGFQKIVTPLVEDALRPYFIAEGAILGGGTGEVAAPVGGVGLGAIIGAASGLVGGDEAVGYIVKVYSQRLSEIIYRDDPFRDIPYAKNRFPDESTFVAEIVRYILSKINSSSKAASTPKPKTSSAPTPESLYHPIVWQANNSNTFYNPRLRIRNQHGKVLQPQQPQQGKSQNLPPVSFRRRNPLYVSVDTLNPGYYNDDGIPHVQTSTSAKIVGYGSPYDNTNTPGATSNALQPLLQTNNIISPGAQAKTLPALVPPFIPPPVLLPSDEPIGPPSEPPQVFDQIIIDIGDGDG